MASKPVWEQIGAGFVQHYYQQFDSDRTKLADLYSLPFQSIQHSITAQDHQPTPDSCVMSMADADQVMGFQQTFLLKNVDNKWICTNDMFRLALHNFGA
ncbi:unnamed protein product [Coregonus sp. 'balchen']|nr:unnamed protein product [Coregonus sp. 'balchen']